ncbi:MAG: hypothetical protein JSR91_08725 [Proteobacteria bacterium]|nr:hypothetical protein [Pseudomonadota bacterium]
MVEDRIVSSTERPAGAEEAPVSAGVYFFCREIFSYLSSKCSLEAAILPAVCRTHTEGATIHPGCFIDIGIPSS